MIIYRGKCEEINTRVSISFLKTMLSIFQFYPNLIITRLRYRHTALNSRTECSTGSVPDVGVLFGQCMVSLPTQHHDKFE